MGRPNARLANVFISRSNPTDVKFFEHKDPYAWSRFMCALKMWQTTKKFGPYFEAERIRVEGCAACGDLGDMRADGITIPCPVCVGVAA